LLGNSWPIFLEAFEIKPFAATGFSGFPVLTEKTQNYRRRPSGRFLISYIAELKVRLKQFYQSLILSCEFRFQVGYSINKFIPSAIIFTQGTQLDVLGM
jgi:hypothetical protein